MWQIASGLLLGWALGSNDAANVFGTAVASRMVKFWTAALLCAAVVLLGAFLEGSHGMETYRDLSEMADANLAFIVALSAGLTVTLMSTWRLPVSTSQAVVGALVLAGLLQHNLDSASLIKVVLCWVGTPVGAALLTVLLYYGVGKLVNLLAPNVFQYDAWLRWGLILAGSYGAFALGANNVANVTGPFYAAGMFAFAGAWEAQAACLVGASAIALGVLTYSHKVMFTVGENLVKLDAFTAFIAILAEAITVHIYALVGVPVSTSQAIVGAVLGIGMLKGMRTIDKATLGRILFGWVGTPAISAALAFLLYTMFVQFGLMS